MVDVGPADDPVDGLADNVERLLEVVEPVLILLSLCGREAIRLAIAGKDTLKAVSVTLDEPVTITGLERVDWPSPITLGLIADPVVVAFGLSSRLGAIPSTRFDDGWFVIGVGGASGSLALVELLGHVKSAITLARDDLLDDVSEVVGTLSFSDLVAVSDRPTGLLTMFDPEGWLIESLTDDQVDARIEGDPDAEALEALGDAAVNLIEPDLGDFSTPNCSVMMRIGRRCGHGSMRIAQLASSCAVGCERLVDGIAVASDNLRRAFRFGRSRRLT